MLHLLFFIWASNIFCRKGLVNLGLPTLWHGKCLRVKLHTEVIFLVLFSPAWQIGKLVYLFVTDIILNMTVTVRFYYLENDYIL